MEFKRYQYKLILNAIESHKEKLQEKYEAYESTKPESALDVNNALGELIWIKHKIKQGLK